MSDCDLCGNGTGDVKYLHAVCHITAPMRGELKDNKLTLRCYVCNREVATFTVDPSPFGVRSPGDKP